MPRTTSTAQRLLQLKALERKPGYNGRLRMLQREGPAASKSHLDFHCLDCGSGQEGGWQMQLNNVLIGMGCPLCEISAPLLDRAEKMFPNLQFSLLTKRRGRPDIKGACVKVCPRDSKLPDGFGWVPPELTLASFKAALNRNGSAPGIKSLRTREELVEIFDAFMVAFPQGQLRYLGRHRPGFTEAGPYFSMKTGPRRMRVDVSGEWVRKQGVQAYVNKEWQDQQLSACLHEEAAINGAEILEIFSNETGHVVVQYRSRTGYIREDTPGRAREMNWGQIGFRQGQALAYSCLSALIPATDWKANHRPSFLNGLELDIFSSEKALALEYNGPHHYGPVGQGAEALANYERQIEHDARRRQLCVEHSIILIEMKHEELDPPHFLQKIKNLCRDAAVNIINKDPCVKGITKAWEEHFNNPLQGFQNNVQRGLGPHVQLSPALERTNRRSTISYMCACCGKLNWAKARGLSGGRPRKSCPNCKGEFQKHASLARTLSVWAGVFPADFLNNLSRDNGNLLYTCSVGHKVQIHNEHQVRRHLTVDGFNCPSCVSACMNISPAQVSQLSRYQQALKDMVAPLGLEVHSFPPYKEDQPVVELKCPHGHLSQVTRKEIELLLWKKALQDGIAPHACPACCYPSLTVAEAKHSRSTLFHRLHIIRGMYAGANWISGFDAKGLAPERYSCGNYHADGSPHSPINISFKDLQRAAKRDHSNASFQSHLCITCSIGNNTSKRSKTTGDLESMMLVLRDQIAELVDLPQPLMPPKVEVIGGDLRGDGEIHTQKTKLRFECGVPGHQRVEANSDYYFNRAPSRGYGFCPDCCKAAKVRKAPHPAPRIFGSLRVVSLTS